MALETVRGAETSPSAAVTGHGFCCRRAQPRAAVRLGAWDELLRSPTTSSGSSQAGGNTRRVARPWIIQVLLWRDRRAEAADSGVGARRGGGDPRRSGLVPAWVADGAGRGPRGSQAGCDRDRRGARPRDRGVAGLVPRELPRGPRPGLRGPDALPLARRLIDHRVPRLNDITCPSSRRPPRSRRRSGDFAEAAGQYERAVAGMERLRPSVETGTGAARGEPRPRAARRPPIGRPRSRAEQIFARLQAQPAVGETTSDPR